MLAPDNRAVLRDLLRPPAGMRVEHAVGTTFTVDLVSALAAPLSLAASELGGVSDPIGVLQTVRSVADRVDVFYQAGQARVPTAASDVFAVLEPVLHPVTAARPGFLFHPKVWLLSFVPIQHDDAPEAAVQNAVRLVVATRNLTDDRSWDAVVSLDGELEDAADPLNAPLQALLRSLPELCTVPMPEPRRERVLRLAEAVGRATWELPVDASDLALHAFGLPAGRARWLPAAPDFTGFTRLVVSPFVDGRGLATVAPDVPGRTTRTVLVSRQETLDRLVADGDLPAGVTAKVMSDVVDLEDERAAGELTGLHAKVTVVQRGRRSHLVLGSPNATGAGHHGNVEFAVELVFGDKHSVERHLSPEHGMGALLEDHTPLPPKPEPEGDLRRTLQGRLRSAAALPWTVEVTEPGEGSLYALGLSSGGDLPPAADGLVVELMTRRGTVVRGRAGDVVEGTVAGVPLADITAFLVLTLTDEGVTEQTVVPAVLGGDPPHRIDAVVARQVDSPEKFLLLVLTMLGLAAGDGGGSAATAALVRATAGGTSSPGAGLLETVVRALTEAPEGLDDLGRVLDHLAERDGEDVVPLGFIDLWTAVKAAREQLEVLR